MGTVKILAATHNPITTMGLCAGICWGADTGSPEKNYMRGLDCIEAGHGRVLEFADVTMLLDGWSARVIREWYTHIGGMPTRLQASTRYIDYGKFEYVTPESIEKDEDKRDCYQDCMVMIAQDVEWLVKQGVPREDAAMLLPLGMTTRVVCKHNLRNLADMSRQRMCKRAYHEFRALFRAVSDALGEIDEEWAEAVKRLFKPKCEVLGYCPEKHGCGKYLGRANA